VGSSTDRNRGWSRLLLAGALPVIVALGEWVLRRACADAAAWHRRWDTTVTVNVSPRRLADPHFTVKALSALRAGGLPATALTLEITEGVLVRSGAHVAQALLHRSALRAEGVRVAIDEGYHFARPVPVEAATGLLALAGSVQVRPVPADQNSDAGRGVSVK
jgi:sensor c-di-GMP phosphodiesterase-like protein